MFSVIRDRYNKHIIASDVRFIASIAIFFILLSVILLALDHACPMLLLVLFQILSKNQQA